MIPLTATVCQDRNRKTRTWRQELASAIRSPEELLTRVGLKPDQILGGISSDKCFPLRVPGGYVARMRPGDPNDPLLLQVLSRQAENEDQDGFLLDPVGDGSSVVQPGLLHKYSGRVLLITTGACPIHCRYCFRRHFPYAENQPDNRDWSAAIAYIEADSSIREVILSGGDPLMMSTDRLEALCQQLARIPHVSRLRIHSRMPIVLPERITQRFLDWIGSLPWQTVLVLHCNHANEIDDHVFRVMARLKAAGISLLNQTVLLKGINDDAHTLINLSESLFSAGILPYYLHLLDRVQGAAHFDISEHQALSILGEIQSQLPGYLVPRLVREVSGMSHKLPIQGPG